MKGCGSFLQAQSRAGHSLGEAKAPALTSPWLSEGWRAKLLPGLSCSEVAASFVLAFQGPESPGEHLSKLFLL